MPSTERPSDCMVSRRHSMSRSTSTAVTPAVDEGLRRLGHVAAEAADVLFGEHRLQCAFARHATARWAGRTGCRPPCAAPRRGRCTARDEGVVACQARRAIPSGENTATSGGTSHFGPSCTRVTGRRASRISSCPVSKRPHRLQQLPDRQRVLRRQRKCADVERRGHRTDHHAARGAPIGDALFRISHSGPAEGCSPRPSSSRCRASPAADRGVSRSTANCSDVGPSAPHRDDRRGRSRPVRARWRTCPRPRARVSSSRYHSTRHSALQVSWLVVQ